MSIFNTGFVDFASHVNSGSGTSWSNVNNMTLDDSNESIVGGSSTINTAYGQGKNPTGNIPVGSMLSGIEIGITRRFSGGSGSYAKDVEVRLFINNIASGDNKALVTNWLTTFPAPHTIYGSLNDLWGNIFPINESIMNAADFGFGIKAIAFSTGNSTNAIIQHTEMNIHYNPSGMFLSM